MLEGKPVNFLLRRGRVIDPASRLDGTADVLILEGRIADVRPEIELGRDLMASVREIDARGLWVTPGWVDMHVHLREPGEEYKETIASGTRAAAAGGYVAVACMPNTQPVNDCAAVTEFIRKRAREEGYCHVFPVGAISRGLKGEELSEFGELREAGAVAVTDDGRPVMSSLMMRRALEYARIFDLPVISHAEDLGLSSGGLVHEGRVASMLGLRGIPAAAEVVMIQRDIALAELTGGRLHIAHVSAAGSVHAIREARGRGIPVTAETAPHYFTLTNELLTGFDPVFKVNPPLRCAEDVEAIKHGLADGTLEVIATDHAPHSVLEKDTEFEYAANGMIGLESALPLVLELVRDGVLTPLQAVEKVSSNPARILGLPLGGLARGEPANLTVLDPDASYVLDARTFQSKSRNCPFDGRAVQGQVVLTLVDGAPAFSRLER